MSTQYANVFCLLPMCAPIIFITKALSMSTECWYTHLTYYYILECIWDIPLEILRALPIGYSIWAQWAHMFLTSIGEYTVLNFGRTFQMLSNMTLHYSGFFQHVPITSLPLIVLCIILRYEIISPGLLAAEIWFWADLKISFTLAQHNQNKNANQDRCSKPRCL